jgi:hypothetical protein
MGTVWSPCEPGGGADLSPDGDAGAYGYNKISAPSSSLEIRILELTMKRITTLPGSQGLYAPEWSPEGRYVAALSSRDYLVLFDRRRKNGKRCLNWALAIPRGRAMVNTFIRGGVKPRPSRRGYKPPLQWCLLLLDVRLQNTDGCATTTGSEIRRRPENTLPITAC